MSAWLRESQGAVGKMHCAVRPSLSLSTTAEYARSNGAAITVQDATLSTTISARLSRMFPVVWTSIVSAHDERYSAWFGGLVGLQSLALNSRHV